MKDLFQGYLDVTQKASDATGLSKASSAYWSTTQKWNDAIVSGAGSAIETLDKGNQVYANKAGVSPTAAPAPSPSPKATPIPKGLTTEAQAAQYGIGAQGEYAKKQGGSRVTGKYDITEDSPVYTGRMKVGNPRQADHAAETGGDKLLPVGEVINQIYGWDDKKTRAFSELASQAGYRVSSTINKTDLIPIWSDMVKLSAGSYRAGKKIDPWTLMRRYSAGGAMGSGGSKTETETNSRVTVTNALTAEQLAHAALSQRLGRAATEMEVAEFKKELFEAEKKNPTITTTTRTTNASGDTSSSTTQKEGINNQDFAIQWAGEHNKAEAQAYQAAGIMMPWFMEALSSPI